MIRAAEVIQRKRDGEELPDEELAELILGYARGEVPDYQMAAFCMAVFFRGLSVRETYVLTDAMIRSGETIDLRAELGRKVVDKHSTGGVGDKTSLAVGPIVAACGVPFGEDERPRPRAHRRDARQARVDPGVPRRARARRIRRAGPRRRSCDLGQTGDLVPADKLLYGLRDVTATVDQLSLIAASIMSKKLAAGAQAIVLDVKVGDGAFMKTIEDARLLAETMLSLGQEAGREVVCLLTDMDQPLGSAVGNAVEVREALDTVRGGGPGDLGELVLDACARLLALSDLGIDVAEGRRRAEAAVADGTAGGLVAPLDRGTGRHRRRGCPPVRSDRAGRSRSDRRLRSPRRGDRGRQRRRAPRRRTADEG